jgi:UDP-N-acetylmuramoyl-tripeptide--D-alanyl-D-alanine ligase
MAWTRRAKTLAAVWLLLEAALVAAGVAGRAGPWAVAVAALAVPLVVDLACALTGPFEKRGADRYVAQARHRLQRVGPTVVAITGSYGKTTTKGYVAHLVAGTKTVVASPASFNNRSGLARAINEGLADGTEVFVAEMGTYGPGEIAELCSWVVPDIAVITAIGPVHLERFRTEERIVAAKAEILQEAATVVLVVDDRRLAALADQAEKAGKRVRRVAGPGQAVEGGAADVSVGGHNGVLTVFVDGGPLGPVVDGAQPGNVAAAVAVALELGVTTDEIGARLAGLPTAPHRLERSRGTGGFDVLDDTYNANPAGARAALAALAATVAGSEAGRRVVVTPGMVELGPRQKEENEALAAAAALVVNDLVVVGRTNRRALLAGAGPVGQGRTALGGGAGGGESDGRPGRPRVVVVDGRAEAVAWVRQNLGPGDVVLYENDLPDHYP